MTNAEMKARKRIAGLGTKEIIKQFELTELMKITVELAMVRGWLMDELEKRNPEAFDAYLENCDTDDNLNHYFN